MRQAQSLVAVDTGVANVVTDPVDTAKGVEARVKRFRVNLGRRAKRPRESVTADDEQPEDQPKDATARRLRRGEEPAGRDRRDAAVGAGR